ncbi:MAG: hypothetical protein K2X62_10735 [Beijerinckiaceae bacterium]|jgi:hypothetical protein|nr:hypothetical protein [Beijerinckiaceae bacterium]MDO9442550.1 hypothetical protein [Beijerinckiaceae bacterium]
MTKLPEHTTSGPSAPEKTAGFDRRGFFRVGGTAAVAAAAAIVPIVDEAVANETGAERTKARYRETDHVKNFYRVNRY